MSIASAITTAQNRVAAAYTACNNKGATMPAAANQNLTNLANTISSITTGGGSANLTSLSVTPTTSAQTITPTSPVDGYDEVNVAAVTSSIDANIIPANIKSGVSVLGVTGICGRNFVMGTFTTSSTGSVQSVTLPYTGSGYPIAAMIFITGGAYASSVTGWYNSTKRYAVGQWTMHKANTTTTPTYTTSGGVNYGVTTAIYKNSTTDSASYTRTSAMNTNTYSSSDASNSAALCCRFKSATSLSIYVASTSYGLLAATDYTYIIIYSA